MLLGTQIKTETDSKSKKWILIEASCNICKKCWYYPERGVCIYGGPFSGYIE